MFYLQYVGAGFDETALSLLQDVLVYDPTKRKTAEQVLKHDYFNNLRKVLQWLYKWLRRPLLLFETSFYYHPLVIR
ncbi:hypothetical protein Y032_0140g2160 [Ancylostoma ceylanicum]|nr:hypothetical protein Y032_0140g2160 [Ancylostoma ceylanicum]